MDIRLALLATATATAMLFAAPVRAGGPVITEDAETTAQPGHSFKDALPLIILGLAIASIAIGGSDNCNQPEEPPADGC